MNSFQGGFGAAKNLSDYAISGEKFKVRGEVEKVVREFHNKKKAIALCCISPVIVAKLLSPTEVTIGKDQLTSQHIQTWGSRSVEKSVNECHVDLSNLLVTSPAYMQSDAKPHQVFEGIGSMIKQYLQLL